MRAEALAVLTPYSAQKEEVSRILRRRRIEDITVKTITESQGSLFNLLWYPNNNSYPYGVMGQQVSLQCDTIGAM